MLLLGMMPEEEESTGASMKLIVRDGQEVDEPEVRITCARVDPPVQRIISAVELEQRMVSGRCNGFRRSVPLGDVLYIESVDRRTFIYTADAVLECSLRLLDLEDALAGTSFVRASRQSIVNLMHAVGMRPYLNARLELLMDNGEHLIASRQYAGAIKARIGL